MARGLNRVTLVGTLTQDPELRYTAGGLAVMELNLAGTEFVTDEQGQTREVPWYHRVKLLGKSAEFWGDNLKAGMALFVDGRLEYRAWEQEGQKRSSLEVRAERIEVLVLEGKRGPVTVTDARGQERLRGGLNLVMLVGNLTRDPEVRYTPQGTAVARLGLAVNERYATRQGAEQERTHYVEAQAWRELAEYAGELRKGEGAFFMGRLVNDSWTAQDGTRRYVTRVELVRLERLARGTVQSGGDGSQNGRAGKVDIDEGLEDFPPEEDLPF
ncbi:MAG: single-stranded DNA-binding protein [Meiothermus sp.]|uniref:single-stranded DNA-binding protein n=1 Tax=Meiothermus sp. TaxID=1955249 RepID=UPI0025D14E4C|nr:single-stranded DNA-binding protein [Meiothermus sp.]MCS7059223.1 single-stranded DNA-binding protein [Meiothermus sp.]MCS7195330.1 single-stranded DNA-binding protein [Meiothermus sp.]MCX7739851.1 single-stranded DNA-binding protein [Meiothermus sp.]MDW8091920.1 single-stranded DNA-binding protein [Meiothermus sp.]MDW8481793.1 single-stranded DNA-binding protein [Meiothermus sp.]